MRSFIKQLGINKRILIVASPAVQDNFKLQMFDERKLKYINGSWNLKACTGNIFLNEINIFTKDVGNNGTVENKRIISQRVNKIISKSYMFLGYVEFSNYVNSIMTKNLNLNNSKKKIAEMKRKSLKKHFSNTLLVIDEVHNLRIINAKNMKLKKTSTENLKLLVSSTDNLKLLILSATPMFNSYLEILWIINLLNINDKRYPIKPSEVFDSNGNFITGDDGHETGKELLIQKARGYISYVKGNNPFTFPYTIYPHKSDNNLSYKKYIEGGWSYPKYQLNGTEIKENDIPTLDLVLTDLTDYQEKGYNYILDHVKQQSEFKEQVKGFSYTVLDPLVQGLNFIYPCDNLDEIDNIKMLYGREGLERTMEFDTKTKKKFKYRAETKNKFGNIFSFPNGNLKKYSSKISNICESIVDSTGIIFIYSQYIDSGAVPVALALEEMGIRRYGNTESLFETPPIKDLNIYDMGHISEDVRLSDKPKSAKYIMITGDHRLTPNLKAEIKAVTSEENKYGENVKVIIVTRAGSEGLDFKNIRQSHILDPWYNYNRQEQIIGRAVRNLSHCNLPYEERNVSIFMHASRFNCEEDIINNTESADLYLYRLSEIKAKKIALVSRILKQNSVDCLLNNRGKIIPLII